MVTAPVRGLGIAHHRDVGHPRRPPLLRQPGGGRRRPLLDREPAGRRRTHRGGAPHLHRRRRRRHPAGLQCPHPGARVRRRGLCACATAWSTSSSSPTSACTGSSPGEEPRPITPEPALPAGLRYADITFGDGFLVCVGERHGLGEVWNELIRLPLDGSEAPQVDRRRPRLLLLAAPLPRRPSPGLAGLGSPRHALERHHPVAGPPVARGHPGRGPSRGRGPGRVDLPAGVVARRGAPLRLGPQRLVEPVPPRGRRGPAGGGRRRRRRGAAVGVPPAPLRLPGRRVDRRRVRLPDGHQPPDPRGRRDHAGPARAGHLAGRAGGRRTDLFLLAGSPTSFPAVVRVDTASGESEVLRAPEGPGLDPGLRLGPRTRGLPHPGWAGLRLLLPAGQSRLRRPPAGDLPPLLVTIHGGPTAAARPVLDPEVQFWTSRGFALADVDYGGSTGYGRAYWERLHGTWGLVDVRDCALAAAHLAATGRADPARLAIRGGSAGGYTTLAALAFRDEFAAGASHFGVADLELLARDTHKFESRYLDWLVGPYPRGARHLSGALPDPPSRRHRPPGDPLPGIGGSGGAPGAGGDHGLGAASAGRAGGPPDLPRRGPRFSPGGEHRPHAGGRVVVLRAGLRLRTGRARSSRWWWKACSRRGIRFVAGEVRGPEGIQRVTAE